MRIDRRIVLGLTLATAIGCQAEVKKTETAEAPKAEAPKADPAPAKAAAKSDPACIGAVGAATAEAIELSNGVWERNGSTLTWKGGTAEGIKLGAVTDIKDGSPENIKNLEKISAFFKAEAVDAVVVAGDSGETVEHITQTLGLLAGLEVPVLAVIGNREGKKNFNEAMGLLAKSHKNVFNLSQIRRVDTLAADLVSLPGYHNPDYLHAEDGCLYYQADVDQVGAVVKTADSPVILVSHGGPLMVGAEAIDYTSQGQNVGDPKLSKLIQEGGIPFGIFGNIHEAGGRACDMKGTLVAQGTLSTQLLLNPGPADSIRWPMNDKTESVGMAAVMTIAGGKASYKVERMKAETAP